MFTLEITKNAVCSRRGLAMVSYDHQTCILAYEVLQQQKHVCERVIPRKGFATWIISLQLEEGKSLYAAVQQLQKALGFLSCGRICIWEGMGRAFSRSPFSMLGQEDD